jgi:guanosine-3',5'-bis(diphosphate) 3'-pyrophosphohydrolase
MDEVLEKIKEYADSAHGEQTRKYSNDRYIVHPIRVMEMCKKYSNDIAVLAAALLHDVIEDTPVTAKELEEFLHGVMDAQDATRTLNLVIELTDIYTKQAFPRFNRRTRKSKEHDRMVKTSAEAQTIKYADIIDNADVTINDVDFALVYLNESRRLLQRMNKGNEDLRQRALEIVNRGIDSVKETRIEQ